MNWGFVEAINNMQIIIFIIKNNDIFSPNNPTSGQEVLLSSAKSWSEKHLEGTDNQLIVEDDCKALTV